VAGKGRADCGNGSLLAEGRGHGMYEGRSINKLQNSVILLVFQI